MVSVIGLVRSRVVPQDHAALRSAESLAGRTGQNHRALVQRILELAAGDQAGLVRAVEDELSAPLGDDLAHLPHGQRERVIDMPITTSLGLCWRAALANSSRSTSSSSMSNGTS